MPKFHIYSNKVHEVVANRTMSGESNNDDDDAIQNDGKGIYSYYLKNTIMYVISATLQYATVNGTLSLVTSLAGEQIGFVALVVTYVAGYLAILTPGLITSLGCKKVIVIVNVGYLVFSIGNFNAEYYTLLPAGVFGGYSIASSWVCGTTYLNTLGVSYAATHKTTENKMISYTNGISMACFSSGLLLGNLVSSLLLLPTKDNDVVKVANSTEECALERPENLSENQWVYFLRGTLTGMCVIALILSVFFLDNLKEESTTKFSIKNLMKSVKENTRETGKAVLQPNIGLVVPWLIACGIAIAVFPGTFSRVYVAECVGVHIIGYVFIVYGAVSAAASVFVGKILGRVSITSVSLLTMCLNVGVVAFLLVWDREPNYSVIFVVAVLWGICDGSWATVASSE